MKALQLSLLLIVGVVVVSTGVLLAGVYDVGADAPHTRAVNALLTLARERSVAARAQDIRVPDLGDPALLRSGAGNYAAMCAGCHLSPGLAESELHRGLYPQPPDLPTRGVADPARAFWTITHGLKATGMPAWGKSMDERSIWGLVAFVGQLPKLSAEEYRAAVQASSGHSHGAPGEHEGDARHEEAGDRHGEHAHDPQEHDAG